MPLSYRVALWTVSHTFRSWSLSGSGLKIMPSDNVEMLRALFGYPPEHGYQIAEQVNSQMRAIVYTTHKEHAELKRDQIHAFGADVRVPQCAGSRRVSTQAR